MKRLLLLLAFCLMLAAPVFAGFTQNFQDTTGYTTCYGSGTGSCTWTQNTTGGNSYMAVGSSAGYKSIINSNSEQTTYAAGTILASPAAPNIKLYDSSYSTIYTWPAATCSGNRVEVLISSSTAKAYCNGVLVDTSGVLAVTPSYVSFGAVLGTNNWDDIVYGSSSQRVVYGMPEEDVFVIKKDMINPASSGVAFKINGTVISSTYMTTTWSRSAIGATGGLNDTLVLANVFSGTIYAQKYTGSKNTSTEYWDIQTALVNSGAPYGWYETYLLNESGSHSIPINYIGTGASVSFDADSYSQQDTATITHAVADGGYWNTGLYNYKLAILNGNTGQFIHNESITVQSGTSTYTFTSSDTQGVYYAVVMATDLATGADVWMNYDWADVSAYITFTGYVNDQSGLPISGANVSFSQGTTYVNQITISDGNYTATGFLTGATLNINTTATGYFQYYVDFVPMVAKTIPLNITLNSTSPSFTGLGIGGVARDGILTGTTITSGYGRPIEAATAYLRNQSTGESCTNVSNMAGWYLFDEGNGCILTSGRPYEVWGNKIGYSNSTIYTVVAA